LAAGEVPADRDFELVWTPEVGHVPKAALFSEKVAGQFYHLLMVLPPQQGVAGGQPMAREVIYVIDTSGSMSGTSIKQAKRSLLMALKRLRPRDRFNIIQFNSSTDLLFRQARAANQNNLRRARRFVRSLDADGGTEMAPALNAALQGQGENQFVRQVIFLTDGSVGNETALFDLIKQHLGQSRLFTIGIGSAPNSYFMRKAAHYGRGSFTYIGDVREVNEKMAALFSKLESPVMTDLDVQFSGGVQAEAWPRRVPDLYYGEPIILVAKASGGKEKVTIKGMRALAPWQATLDLDQGHRGEGIGVLWARSKIAALMESLHDGADQAEVRKAVINVALNHHLVSRYTSLVAVDVTPTRPQSAALDSHALPVNLPQGQNYQKIFGQLPQTATPAARHLIIGFVLLLLVWLILHLRLFEHVSGGYDK
jgi:Ca-activated chloride channel family protein